MMINSFSFHLSKKTHIISFNSEWKSCWVENSWLKVFFFLLALWICYTTFFRPAEFLLKNQQIPLWAFLVYNKFFFFLADFEIISLSLIFEILNIICFVTDLHEFILFGTLRASWTWMSVSYRGLGKFSVAISPSFLALSFSSWSSVITIMKMIFHSMSYQGPLLYVYFLPPNCVLFIYLFTFIFNYSWCTILFYIRFGCTI